MFLNISIDFNIYCTPVYINCLNNTKPLYLYNSACRRRLQRQFVQRSDPSKHPTGRTGAQSIGNGNSIRMRGYLDDQNLIKNILVTGTTVRRQR